MITTMTDEQREQMAVYAKRWIEIGLNTQPADRPRAEAGIRRAYEIAGLKAPAQIVWLESPARIADVFIRASVRDAVGASVWASVRDSVGGQFDTHTLAYYAYFHDVYELRTETQALEGLWEIAQSANWWFPCREVCYVCERPRVIAFDAQGRLHRADGAAVEYSDGWGVYAWHGMRVAKKLITEPITLAQIDNERNVELRRMMLERYGYERYIQDSDSVKLHEDSFGVLWGKAVPGDEAIVMVQVKDPSTDRQYFLRVPPTVKTAHEAVAWTFGMTVNQYRPKFES